MSGMETTIEGDMDTIDALIFQKLPTQNLSSNTNPRKRYKPDDVSHISSPEFKEVKDRLSRLENMVTDLVSALQDKHSGHDKSTLPHRRPTNEDIPSEDRDQWSDLNITTKETKNEFYKLYGQLKTLKTTYTKDELNKRLTDEEFVTFKEIRTSLTTWLKTGLAISRQLEDFYRQPTELELIPPC